MDVGGNSDESWSMPSPSTLSHSCNTRMVGLKLLSAVSWGHVQFPDTISLCGDTPTFCAVYRPWASECNPTSTGVPAHAVLSLPTMSVWYASFILQGLSLWRDSKSLLHTRFVLEPAALLSQFTRVWRLVVLVLIIAYQSCISRTMPLVAAYEIMLLIREYHAEFCVNVAPFGSASFHGTSAVPPQ